MGGRRIISVGWTDPTRYRTPYSPSTMSDSFKRSIVFLTKCGYGDLASAFVNLYKGSRKEVFRDSLAISLNACVEILGGRVSGVVHPVMGNLLKHNRYKHGNLLLTLCLLQHTDPKRPESHLLDNFKREDGTVVKLGGGARGFGKKLNRILTTDPYRLGNTEILYNAKYDRPHGGGLSGAVEACPSSPHKEHDEKIIAYTLEFKEKPHQQQFDEIVHMFYELLKFSAGIPQINFTSEGKEITPTDFGCLIRYLVTKNVGTVVSSHSLAKSLGYLVQSVTPNCKSFDSQGKHQSDASKGRFCDLSFKDEDGKIIKLIELKDELVTLDTIQDIERKVRKTLNTAQGCIPHKEGTPFLVLSTKGSGPDCNSETYKRETQRLRGMGFRLCVKPLVDFVVTILENYDLEITRGFLDKVKEDIEETRDPNQVLKLKGGLATYIPQ